LDSLSDTHERPEREINEKIKNGTGTKQRMQDNDFAVASCRIALLKIISFPRDAYIASVEGASHGIIVRRCAKPSDWAVRGEILVERTARQRMRYVCSHMPLHACVS